VPVTTPGRVRRRGRRRAIIVTAAAGVVIAGGLVFLVVQFVAASPDRANLGPRVFKVGRADRLAPRIAQDGPLLFKDTLNRGREIYVQHRGGDEEKGWMAFEAYGAGAPRTPDCVLVWEQEERHFRDPCGSTPVAADGAGLVHYQATVDGGTVVVDLNRRT